jgi:uncharacterized protein
MTGIDYDPAKRALNLAKHGLDFEDAQVVFAGRVVTRLSPNSGTDEARWISVGSRGGRVIVIVWTWRGEIRRIVSMRSARGGEKRLYLDSIGDG